MPPPSLEPHEYLPDIWVNEELMVLNLGVFRANGLELFYCLACKVCVARENLSNGRHFRTRENHPKLIGMAKKVAKTLPDYGITLAAPEPLVGQVLPHMPALPQPLSAGRCTICHPKFPYNIVISHSHRRKHRRRYHKEDEVEDVPVLVQRLFDPREYSYNKWTPEVYIPPTPSTLHPLLGPNLGVNTPSNQRDLLFQQYLQVLSSATNATIMPKSTDIGDTDPLLQSLQWAKIVQGFDKKELMTAVSLPQEEDDFFPVIEACHEIFKQQQTLIGTTHSSLRRLWVADSTIQSIFNPLQKEKSWVTYSRHSAKLVAFILRTQSGLIISQSIYPDQPEHLLLYLTADQKLKAQHVLEFLDDPDDSLPLQTSIRELLVSCFAPKDVSHMVSHPGQFADIVHVFCILNAINADCRFCPAHNLTYRLAYLQYNMRAILLEHILQIFNKGKTSSGQNKVNINELATSFQAEFLARHRVTPYGTLQDVKAIAWPLAKIARQFPNVQWAGDNPEAHTVANIRGKTVEIDDLKTLVQSLLATIQRILYHDLLLDIHVETFNILGIDLKLVVDEMSDRTPRSGVFSAGRNQHIFGPSSTQLLNLFLKDPTISKRFFDTSHSTPGASNISSVKQKTWLKHWDRLILHLAVLMHAVGGQPGRITELLALLLVNTPHRQRGLYIVNGQFIFVLFKSKLSWLTAMDRIIVHGLPKELNQILILANNIVRPVVMLWGAEVWRDTSIRDSIRDKFFCRSNGTTLVTEDLSGALRRLTKSVLHVSLGVSDWRHLSILIMRHYFNIELMPITHEKEKHNLWDHQASHTAAVSHKHYAVEPIEWYQFKGDTMSKQLYASSQVSNWYLESEVQDEILDDLDDTQSDDSDDSDTFAGDSDLDYDEDFSSENNKVGKEVPLDLLPRPSLPRAAKNARPPPMESDDEEEVSIKRQVICWERTRLFMKGDI